MATIVPSLEQLPPEKGSLLELHSINEKYNGTIVEYQALDKKTGKHQVVTYGEQRVPMQVKFRVLRRLPLKPLELRRLLQSLAMQITGTLETNPQPEQDRKSLEDLLKKDICCSAAHFGLALLEHETTQSDTEAEKTSRNESIIRHLQRGLANLYAYQGILLTSYVLSMKSFLAQTLSSNEDHKACRKLMREVQWEQSGKDPLQRANDQFTAGNAIFMMANGFKDEGRTTAKYAELAHVAADHMLKVFKLLSRLEGDLSPSDIDCIQHITTASAQGIEEAVLTDKDLLSALHAKEVARHNVDERGNPRQTKEMRDLWKRSLRLSKGILEACTAPDGTVKYLDSRQQEFFKLDMDYAAKQIEAGLEK